MSSIGTLWTTNYHGSGKVILSAAALGGLSIDVPADYKHWEDNKKPEFLSKFPHGKIPAFESKDGFCLTESYAIARYVAALAPNSGLLTSDLQTNALIDQWSYFAGTEINPYISYIFALVKGIITPYNKPIHIDNHNRSVAAYTTLNSHLANNTYLVGERLTLADLIVASFIARAVTINLDAELRQKFPHVIRHLETVVNQPAIKDIWGPIEYAEKALAFVPPPKEKKEAPKPQPKAEKPKAVEEDDDEKPVPEVKAKHPCEDLPKSSFNLEDWKRFYSNNDTPDAIEWLKTNFDPEGFSVWDVSYKYPEELEPFTFKCSNLITGFFTRLEGSRKYLFGSMGVLAPKETNDQTKDKTIRGIFILRGQDYLPVFEVGPDYESYEFKKIPDIKSMDEETEKAFKGLLSWEFFDEKNGLEWKDGKNFK